METEGNKIKWFYGEDETGRFESIRMLLNMPAGWPTFVQSYPLVKTVDAKEAAGSHLLVANPQTNNVSIHGAVIKLLRLFYSFPAIKAFFCCRDRNRFKRVSLRFIRKTGPPLSLNLRRERGRIKTCDREALW